MRDNFQKISNYTIQKENEQLYNKKYMAKLIKIDVIKLCFLHIFLQRWSPVYLTVQLIYSSF